MPIGTPTFIPSTDVNVNKSTNVKITNLNITLGSTEFTHAFVNNLNKYSIAARNDAVLQIAFTVLESGTKYVTIPKGVIYFESDLDFSSTSLYIQANKACIVEIMEFYS